MPSWWEGPERPVREVRPTEDRGRGAVLEVPRAVRALLQLMEDRVGRVPPATAPPRSSIRWRLATRMMAPIERPDPVVVPASSAAGCQDPPISTHGQEVEAEAQPQTAT